MQVSLPSEELESTKQDGVVIEAENATSESKHRDWSLERFPLSEATAAALRKKGITELTEIQAITFNDMRSGRDVIGRSHTGTGKTFAFGVPLVERLVEARVSNGSRRGAPGRSPCALVLTPTRELAKQVTEQLRLIGQPHGLAVDCFYGGASYTQQEEALRRGFDVLVGTPGRILDHLDRGTLNLSNIRIAVLDEADEMLSLGFAEDVERIFQKMPPKEERQTVLFSATITTLSAEQRPGPQRMFAMWQFAYRMRILPDSQCWRISCLPTQRREISGASCLRIQSVKPTRLP
jgi:superfamily II DNA/RNA helicase